MIKEILNKTEEALEKAINHLKVEFWALQAWKANPAMAEWIKVNAYGQMMDLKACSSITAPEAQQLHISPWDKSLISSIEKALRESSFGFNPQNNWDVIIINIPALTEEKRRDLVKIVHKKSEESKISIRQARHDAKAKIEKMQKDKEISEDELKSAESDLQKLVDDKNKKVDEMTKHKEADIMKV